MLLLLRTGVIHIYRSQQYADHGGWSNAVSGFVWIGGRPSLDLCNTAANGTDLLREPADVTRWLTEAGLGVPERPPAARDVDRFRALRADLRSGFLAREPEAIADVVAAMSSSSLYRSLSFSSSMGTVSTSVGAAARKPVAASAPGSSGSLRRSTWGPPASSGR